LKLNGTHQLLVYADDVNRVGGSIHTTEKNTEASVIASKVTGLKGSADKTKSCLEIRMQVSHNMKTDNRSSEMVKSSNVWEQI